MTPELARAIATACDIARRLGFQPVLVGAVAGELAVQARPGLPTPRATNDADFALRLPDWRSFQRMKAALTDAGLRPNPHMEHRLSLGTALVDLIPYGPGVADEHGRITWPASGFVMNVVGFEEACGRTREGTLPGGVRIPYVDVPEFMLLKIVAFVDRQSRGDDKYRNDADDIHFWLRNYPGDAEEGRCHELAGRGPQGVDFQTAGAALLGMDVYAIGSVPADAHVRRFLALAGNEYGPFVNAVIPPGFDEGRAGVVKFIAAFRAGYEWVE